MATGRSAVIGTDIFVPHISRVRANAGQFVGLHVRHKALASAAAMRTRPGKGRVVLFVHGGHVPVVPAFDLGYKDYSWMAYLARAGFRVYGMDLSGYGSSPRPMMDDPANVIARHQPLLIPTQLKAPCPPNYPFRSHTIRSDWAEMDSVVDYLRRLNEAKKVSLVGWSGGGPRCGGYASLHPDKVDRMVLFAPGLFEPGLTTIPTDPGPGAPTKLQTRTVFEKDRWDPDVAHEGQVAPGVRDAVWKQIMQWDAIGASWGPPEGGGVIRAPARVRGWTPPMARKVKAPVLVIVGDHDKAQARRAIYEELRVKDKAFVLVAYGSHFMAWEKQRHVLHSASLEWLAKATINGQRRGAFRVDWDGRWSADSATPAA